MSDGIDIARRRVHFNRTDVDLYDRIKESARKYYFFLNQSEKAVEELADSWLKAYVIVGEIFANCDDPEECTRLIRERINASDVDVELIHRCCVFDNQHLEEEEQPDGSIAYRMFDDDLGAEEQSVSEWTDEFSKLHLIDHVMMGGQTLSLIPSSGKVLFPIAKAFNKQIEISEGCGDEILLRVGTTGKKDNKKGIDVPIGIKNPLSGEHVMVQRAILTMFYNSGDTKPITVTPEQIYRVCCNLPTDATVKRENAVMIENAMDYLRSTPIIMDFSEQYTKYAENSKDEKNYHLECKVDAMMIHADKLTNIFSSESGSTIRVAYRIYSRPTLCEYSGLFRQIKSTDTEMLSGKVDSDISKNTFEANAIRSAVYSRIIAIKSPSYERYEPIIKIDDIVSVSRTSEDPVNPTPRQRRTIISIIEQYLMFLTGKGEIMGYAPVKKGNKLIGYNIRVEKDKKKR